MNDIEVVTVNCNWRDEVERLRSVVQNIENEYNAKSTSREWFWFKPYHFQVHVYEDARKESFPIGKAIEKCGILVERLSKEKQGKKALFLLSDIAKTLTAIIDKMKSLNRIDEKFRLLEAERERLKAINDAEGLKKLNQIFANMMNQTILGQEPTGIVIKSGQVALRSEKRQSYLDEVSEGVTDSVTQTRSMAQALADQLMTIEIENEWVKDLNAEIKKLADKLDNSQGLSKKELDVLMERADFWLNSCKEIELLGSYLSKAISELRPVAIGDISPETAVFVVEYFSRVYPEISLRYNASLRMIEIGGG